MELWESRGRCAGMGGGARPRDFQRPVGARLASLRIQRDGERASTGRAGPQCRVGHGARSAHALTASSFSMNWNGAGAGQRPAQQQPDETPSTPMKRDRAGAGQRPARRCGPVLRKGRGLGQGVPRLANHAPRRPLPPTLAGGCHRRQGVGRGRDACRGGPTPRCPRVHAARSSR